MTNDSDLGHIYVPVPEGVSRIHFRQFVENESHIRDEDILCESTDCDTLSSSISVYRPIGLRSNFMPVWEYGDQRIRRMIGRCDHEAVTCQPSARTV
jgi:hypothetical protein